jgi:disulfide bond formation protein DsbB
MNLPRLSTRGALAAAALVSAALLGFGFYLQYVEGLKPCPLCMVQRGFYVLLIALFALGALHGPARTGAIVYGALGVLFAAGGIAAAGRQVWLQHLPADQVPACGPSLKFMLDNFPLGETLERLFQGDGECAVVDWRFLGLSIAEWSLLCFVLLACYSAWVALRRTSASSRSTQSATG